MQSMYRILSHIAIPQKQIYANLTKPLNITCMLMHNLVVHTETWYHERTTEQNRTEQDTCKKNNNF